MRRVKQTVPLDECKRRVLRFMAKAPLQVYRASQMAHEIWPEAEFRAQGAGAAASRILTHMVKDDTVRWHSSAGDWGYVLTGKGRKEAE